MWRKIPPPDILPRSCSGYFQAIQRTEIFFTTSIQRYGTFAKRSVLLRVNEDEDFGRGDFGYS